MLVEPYRQVKFGLMFIGLNILFGTIIFSVFGYYILDVYESVTTYFQLNGVESSVTLQKFQKPIWVAGGVVIAFIVSTLYLAIKYTHGIYGPLVSIQRFLDEIVAGKQPSPISLRSSDQLQELSEKLNQLPKAYLHERPLSAVVGALEDLIAGKKPEPLRLRKQDPLNPIAEKINELAESSSNIPQTPTG